ncbi:hypothetical protein ACS0TY_021514 [Phlomoides rotata]
MMNFLNSTFLTCFLYSSLSIALPQDCNPNDLSALKEFSSQLINGSIKSSWPSDEKCCNWEYVVCGDDGGSRVIMLKLSGKGLKGKVSVALCKFDRLKVIDLSHNILNGELLGFGLAGSCLSASCAQV